MDRDWEEEAVGEEEVGGPRRGRSKGLTFISGRWTIGSQARERPRRALSKEQLAAQSPKEAL